MNLSETKYHHIKMPDGQHRIIGKYGFVCNWGPNKLGVCIESPKVAGLVKKMLKIVPNSKLHVQGDFEAYVIVSDNDLKLVSKLLKLHRKSTVTSKVSPSKYAKNLNYKGIIETYC